MFPILGRSSRERLSNCLSTPENARDQSQGIDAQNESAPTLGSKLELQIWCFLFLCLFSILVPASKGGFFNPGKGVEYVIIPQSLWLLLPKPMLLLESFPCLGFDGENFQRPMERKGHTSPTNQPTKTAKPKKMATTKKKGKTFLEWNFRLNFGYQMSQLLGGR